MLLVRMDNASIRLSARQLGYTRMCFLLPEYFMHGKLMATFSRFGIKLASFLGVMS